MPLAPQVDPSQSLSAQSVSPSQSLSVPSVQLDSLEPPGHTLDVCEILEILQLNKIQSAKQHLLRIVQMLSRLCR